MSKRHRKKKKAEHCGDPPLALVIGPSGTGKNVADTSQGTDKAQTDGEGSGETREPGRGTLIEWPRWLVEFGVKLRTDPVALFTAVVAVVTTAYVVVSIYQLSALNRATDLANRAWVLLDTIDKVDIRPGVQVGTIVRFKNFGSGPALDVHFIVAVHPPTTSKLLPVDHLKPLRPGIGEAHGTVAQGQGISAVDVRVGGFDPSIIAGMQEERVHFYVYGRIEYRDQFGKGHWTAFCRRLEIHDLKVGTTGLFAACRGSDDAD